MDSNADEIEDAERYHTSPNSHACELCNHDSGFFVRLPLNDEHFVSSDELGCSDTAKHRGFLQCSSEQGIVDWRAQTRSLGCLASGQWTCLRSNGASD
jgi:hypothetical protein